MRSHNRANQKQDTEVQNNPKPKFSKTQYRATISSKTATIQNYLRTPFSSDKPTPVRKTIKDQVAFHTDINGQDCNSIRPYFHTEFHQQYLTLAQQTLLLAFPLQNHKDLFMTQIVPITKTEIVSITKTKIKIAI